MPLYSSLVPRPSSLSGIVSLRKRDYTSERGRPGDEATTVAHLLCYCDTQEYMSWVHLLVHFLLCQVHGGVSFLHSFEPIFGVHVAMTPHYSVDTV